ncbi:hypothetical protein K1719_040400 [Acacia pycnantha]|nr:hypothetical protein K1719_040400 [Acacia pycnantha]
MASSLLTRMLLGPRLIHSSRPQILTSFFNKSSFPSQAVPAYTTQKARTTGWAHFSMASSSIRTQASYSTVSIPTDDPVVQSKVLSLIEDYHKQKKRH